jgi:hypothetical protein
LKTGRHGDITLELHGSFSELAQLLGAMPKYPLIHGIAESTRDLTLYRCFSSGSHIGAFVQERIWVGTAFVGGQFSEDQLVFNEVHFKSDHLADWAQRSGFVPLNPPPDGMRWVVGYRSPGPVKATLSDDVTVEIAFEGGLHLEQGRIAGTEAPVLVVKVPNPTGHREITNRFLFPLRDLLTFATTTPAFVEEIDLHTPHAVHRLGDGTEVPADVELIGRLIQPRDEDRELDRMYPHQMLFSLTDWPSDFSALVHNWLEISERYESSLRLLMGLYYAPPLWQATRVLTLTQALEAYHRVALPESPASVVAAERKARILAGLDPDLPKSDRHWLSQRLEHAEEPTLRKRLQEVGDRVAVILDPMLSNTAQFADELANVRNTFRRESGVIERDGPSRPRVSVRFGQGDLKYIAGV